MTAQIGDKFTFEGDSYSIVAMSKEIGINPMRYNIMPDSICTACWKGYWCEYDISKDGIILKNLFINSINGQYPDIKGVQVSPFNSEENENMGHHVYKNLDIPVKYTGKIVVGKDFLFDYYIHMGYQRAWAYQILTEYDFKRGKLVKTIDHSESAAKIREYIDSKPKSGNRFIDAQNYEGSIEEFVETSFSLDMKKKCWWI